MQPHKVVSREEWVAARKAHLANEKELTRLRDKLSAERRELPWVKVEKEYVFDTPQGKKRSPIFSKAQPTDHPSLHVEMGPGSGLRQLLASRPIMPKAPSCIWSITT